MDLKEYIDRQIENMKIKFGYFGGPKAAPFRCDTLPNVNLPLNGITPDLDMPIQQHNGRFNMNHTNTASALSSNDVSDFSNNGVEINSGEQTTDSFLSNGWNLLNANFCMPWNGIPTNVDHKKSTSESSSNDSSSSGYKSNGHITPNSVKQSPHSFESMDSIWPGMENRRWTWNLSPSGSVPIRQHGELSANQQRYHGLEMPIQIISIGNPDMMHSISTINRHLMNAQKTICVWKMMTHHCRRDAIKMAMLPKSDAQK
ncbi:uncharacterized protein LOC116336865 [Contarinia nasturtii]|uniref:uncharacterized protein LOC116336865 n=1 Tax=Contarinia nasturtii TaxID=265458 RepID=UPI0012D37797|nr:uncharacterized protein LOC116336865 [Contarinia nasturtii]